ncbi:MAG TPA: SAM-dependent methyltransferase [Tepidisphaeraceae bacterium]|nr:SAM-dependent methyltransferase [Tepidisphaeraceae bacterium]
MAEFVSRAGQKLEHALATFGIDVTGRVCADLGSNTGGFTDCMLRRGAARVYAIDTGYGVLEWKLRKDPRVIVMERTNAMHAVLPEPVSMLSIDVAWTKQQHILPAARRMIADGGDVVTLIKPHYEAAPALLRGGVLEEAKVDAVVESVLASIAAAGFQLLARTLSPIKGAKGNAEVLAHLRPVVPSPVSG